MVENALIGTTEFDIFSLNPATCAENWRTHEDYPPAFCRPTEAPPTWTACCFAAPRTGGCWPMTSRPASDCGKRRSRTRNAASRCRRRRSPGMASSSSAMRAATSRAGRATCTRSTQRPARSSGSSFWSPEPRATSSADRRARRRSTASTWKNAPGIPISGGGTWTSYTLDTKTGLLYVPGGNPAPDFAIGAREGDNLFTDSVVVLDAKTGDYKTHFQVVKKDWHDWDVSNPPILIQTMGGKQLMAVAPKDGYLYGFDLATNALLYRVPVTRIEDVAVPFRPAKTSIFVRARWGARNGTAQPTIPGRTLSWSARSTGATR